MNLRALAAFGLAAALATAAHAQEPAPPVDAAAAPAPSPTEAPAPPEAQAPAEAPGDAAQPLPDIVPGKLAAAKPGKGQVVFFRPNKFMGGGITWKVRETGAELGTLSSGRYLIIDAEPGAHTYTATTEATDAITIEVEEGDTYYIETAVSMGALIYRPNLRPSSLEAFVGNLKSMKPAKTPKPAN